MTNMVTKKLFILIIYYIVSPPTQEKNVLAREGKDEILTEGIRLNQICMDSRKDLDSAG
jgi:hypothetical protein